MRSPLDALRCGTAALLLATSACVYTHPMDLSPDVMRELRLPAVGETAAAVAAANGAPDRREQVDGRELWVYARLLLDALPYHSRTAAIWFRDGVVVDVATTDGYSTPVPTVPLPATAR